MEAIVRPARGGDRLVHDGIGYGGCLCCRLCGRKARDALFGRERGTDNACKDCGANDATAEKNADGGPVLYIGLNKADGTARPGGNGFAPEGTIKLEDELRWIFIT